MRPLLVPAAPAGAARRRRALRGAGGPLRVAARLAVDVSGVPGTARAAARARRAAGGLPAAVRGTGDHAHPARTHQRHRHRERQLAFLHAAKRRLRHQRGALRGGLLRQGAVRPGRVRGRRHDDAADAGRPLLPAVHSGACRGRARVEPDARRPRAKRNVRDGIRGARARAGQRVRGRDRGAGHERRSAGHRGQRARGRGDPRRAARAECARGLPAGTRLRHSPAARPGAPSALAPAPAIIAGRGCAARCRSCPGAASICAA
jgi:hypothetical protein